MNRTVIAGTGSHIPSVVVPNEAFLEHAFHGPDQTPRSSSSSNPSPEFASGATYPTTW